jgi:hypothetical protein
MELTTLFLLGTYHGINPGMGWLFAVGLGLQEGRGHAVWRSLLPMALGHTLAIGIVVALAGLIQVIVPTQIVSAVVAVSLIGFGLYKLFRHRHPRFGGMRVGFKDLVVWSFLMASAHGAGLMVLPFLGTNATAAGHHDHMAAAVSPESGLFAVAIHTLGYLLVTGLAAYIFYKKVGLALLRKAWLNLDLIWAVALIGTGLFTWFA